MLHYHPSQSSQVYLPETDHRQLAARTCSRSQEDTSRTTEKGKSSTHILVKKIFEEKDYSEAEQLVAKELPNSKKVKKVSFLAKSQARQLGINM